MIDSAEWIIVINHSLCLKRILFLREFLFFFVLLQKPASIFYLICSSNFPISTNTKKVHSSQEVALWIWVRKWLQWQWVHGLRLLRIRWVLFRVSTILKKILHILSLMQNINCVMFPIYSILQWWLWRNQWGEGISASSQRCCTCKGFEI